MTQTAEKKQVFVEATIKLRLAVAADFRVTTWKRDEDDNVYSEIAPKIGQPYWLRSIRTQEFDNRNYQITEDMTKEDWAEFKMYLRQEMVYVPASIFELLDAGKS